MSMVNISEVVVGERARKDLGNIDDLAASLATHGQIQPIVLDNKNMLIAGGRRLAAAKQLGWSQIRAITFDDLDPHEKLAIELEENIRRKEFNWPEEVLALERLYRLRQDLYGERVQGHATDGYGVKDASEELDKSVGSVSLDLQLARALHEFPDLAFEKSKAAALRRYKILRESTLRRELASRATGTPIGASKLEEVDISDPKPEVRKATFDNRGVMYFGDAKIVLKSLPDECVDCIIADPPFAIGLYKEGDQTTGKRLADHSGLMYDDDPTRVLDMIDQVVAQCSRVLKADGHAYFFFHHNRYQDLLDILENHFGESVEATPIIWIKNTSGIGNPNNTWVYAYEPCFFVNRGRAMAKPQAFNYLRFDTVPPKDKIHPTEKPTMLLRHIVTASCVEGEVVLDPFAGSGSTLVAALQCNCKFIGVEILEESYMRILDRLSLELGEEQHERVANNN